MVYNVTKYDGGPLATVADSSLDTTSTSITLIGRNAVNFGLPLNENFVALMQNFANASPPPSPIQGQIWFSTLESSLKVWDGFRWLTVTPPFDGNAGTATVSISPTVEVMLFLSASQIVSAVSHQQVSPSSLPDDVEIAGTNFAFKARFPNGLMPGITLAQDGNFYRFFGTSTSSNVLATARNITVNGSVSGSTMFDGSQNVVITTSLPSVFNANLNTSSFWSKVKVESNGLVTDANVIVDQDVFAALGYTPPSDVRIIGDATGNAVATGTVFNVNISLSSTGVLPGTYSTVTVDTKGRVVNGSNSTPVVPLGGMIIMNEAMIPTGWVECNGQVVVNDQGTFNTPNASTSIAGYVYIMRVA